MHPSLVVPYPGTELREQYEPYLYKDLGWEYYTGAYALFEHPDPAMTPEVREEQFYETSLEVLQPGAGSCGICSRCPAAEFPSCPYPVADVPDPGPQGMKIAYEKWKADRDTVAEKRRKHDRLIGRYELPVRLGSAAYFTVQYYRSGLSCSI